MTVKNIRFQKKRLYDHNFWVIVLEATEKTQTPFLRRAINNVFSQKELSKLIA